MFNLKKITGFCKFMRIEETAELYRRRCRAPCYKKRDPFVPCSYPENKNKHCPEKVKALLVTFERIALHYMNEQKRFEIEFYKQKLSKAARKEKDRQNCKQKVSRKQFYEKWLLYDAQRAAGERTNRAAIARDLGMSASRVQQVFIQIDRMKKYRKPEALEKWLNIGTLGGA